MHTKPKRPFVRNGHFAPDEVAEYLNGILPQLAKLANEAGLCESAALLRVAARISHQDIEALDEVRRRSN